MLLTKHTALRHHIRTIQEDRHYYVFILLVATEMKKKLVDHLLITNVLLFVSVGNSVLPTTDGRRQTDDSDEVAAATE